MSASSKKKFRKEQVAAELTEKQLKEKSESKKLKAYSVTFIVCILVVVIAAIAIAGVTTVNRYGLIERNTIAATVDGQEFDSIEMNYYFTDHVSNFMTNLEEQYGESAYIYAMMLGLDMSTPLDEQECPEEGFETWADYFYGLALDSAKSDYVLCKLAEENGFDASESVAEDLDVSMAQLQLYTIQSGFGSADEYLRAVYGNGANEETYRAHTEKALIASAYYDHYSDSLTFEDADLRAHEEENGYKMYNSYTYNVYYVSYSTYLEGGTEDEDGNVTYSDEEKDAARAKAKEVAEKLSKCTTVEELDAAIAELPVTSDTAETASTAYKDVLPNTIDPLISDWVVDDARQPGDVECIANVYTSTDDDGNETSYENGYYIVIFGKCNENLRPLANVRHLLVKFKSETGASTYTDEEKADARNKAEDYLEQWKSGEATEESFIEMIKEYSDDTSASSGGLFEDVLPVQGVYVESFTNWAIDDERKAGDAEVIETEYGYHVMYYVGDSEINYRDYMITHDLRISEMSLWYQDVMDDYTATKGDLSRLNTSIVLDSSVEAE